MATIKNLLSSSEWETASERVICTLQLGRSLPTKQMSGCPRGRESRVSEYTWDISPHEQEEKVGRNGMCISMGDAWRNLFCSLTSPTRKAQGVSSLIWMKTMSKPIHCKEKQNRSLQVYFKWSVGITHPVSVKSPQNQLIGWCPRWELGVLKVHVWVIVC